MKRLISLLNQKNHYLEKFYSANEKEIQRFLNGAFEGVESFYDTRERILDVIKYIDSEIEKAQVGAEKTLQNDAQMRKTIQESLFMKDQYVAKIIEQDIQILSCIEGAKNGIIRELQAIRKNKKAITGYKAPVINARIEEDLK